MVRVTPDEYLDHFRARVLQDAFAEATADYWLRRAEAYEAARPRLTDHPGGPVDFITGRPLAPPNPASRVERWRHASERAAACRARAAVELMYRREPA